MKPVASARAMASVPVARRCCRARRPGAVSDMTTFRPSPGSGRRSTRPRSSRPASVAPMDWGLICSCLASSLLVAGPSRSSRDRQVDSGMVSSPAALRWRKRRTSKPMLALRSATSSSMPGSPTIPSGDLISLA